MIQNNRPSADELPATKSAMTLFDDYVPGVTAGSYRLAVQQSVEYADQAHHYYQDRGFVVQGPRYALAPDEVQCRFPPANGSGDYKTTLPHIVLRKRALHWERPVWGVGENAEPAPWLALLVLSQRELSDAALELGLGGPSSAGQANPLMTIVTPADLFLAPNALQRYSGKDGGVTLLPILVNEGDDGDTQTKVQVLDLPLDLFCAVCPTQKDLLYLAHVRRVDTSDKVPLNMHATGDFSVVVANRVPQPGSNVVFLVSLEGWHDLIDGPTTRQGNRVRLVVLDTWMFNDDEDGVHTFGELMKDLNVAPFGAGSPSRKDGADEDSSVNVALRRGYVPVGYRPWRSTPTFGWYRGPLSPTRVAPLDAHVRLFRRADAALILDDATGIFDLSYAAAWQLGQLTALASPHVAQELRDYLDQSHDGVDIAQNTAKFLSLHSAAVERTLNQQKLSGQTSAGANRPNTSASKDIDAATTLMEFLVRLAMFYPVPYEYLVAHERLLPRESMRFFYVDNNWLDALIQAR